MLDLYCILNILNSEESDKVSLWYVFIFSVFSALAQRAFRRYSIQMVAQEISLNLLLSPLFCTIFDIGVSQILRATLQ